MYPLDVPPPPPPFVAAIANARLARLQKAKRTPKTLSSNAPRRGGISMPVDIGVDAAAGLAAAAAAAAATTAAAAAAATAAAAAVAEALAPPPAPPPAPAPAPALVEPLVEPLVSGVESASSTPIQQPAKAPTREIRSLQPSSNRPQRECSSASPYGSTNAPTQFPFQDAQPAETRPQPVGAAIRTLSASLDLFDK